MQLEQKSQKFNFVNFLPQIIVLTLFLLGVLILVWISHLTWNDINFWNKELSTILFGSRTDEAISLGIGMTVIHYYLIGATFLVVGSISFLRKRILLGKQAKPLSRDTKKIYAKTPKVKLIKSEKVSKKLKNKESKTAFKPILTEENAAAQEERLFSGCLHYFGYLSNRPKDSPIPQECIICQRLGDCMVATVYIKDGQ